MEPSSNYTPLKSSPNNSEVLAGPLKYFLVVGIALISLALIITTTIFLSKRAQQQNQPIANQVEPTLEPVKNGEKQLVPTTQVASSSFTTADADRLKKALSSQNKEEYSSVYQEAIRELTKDQGAPFLPGTTIDINPATFIATGSGEIGTVMLSTSGATNKKYTLYLIREQNDWFIYAAEEQTKTCGGWDTSGEVICKCSGKIVKSVCPTNAVCDSGIYTCEGECGDCCYKGIAQNNKYPKCVE